MRNPRQCGPAAQCQRATGRITAIGSRHCTFCASRYGPGLACCMARAQPGQTASSSPAGDVRLKADLMTAGFDVTKADTGLGIVHKTDQCAAKLIIFGSHVTGPALFEVTKAIYALAPRPIIVFTNDPTPPRSNNHPVRHPRPSREWP